MNGFLLLALEKVANAIHVNTCLPVLPYRSLFKKTATVQLRLRLPVHGFTFTVRSSQE
jgi:hypothetical protein